MNIDDRCSCGTCKQCRSRAKVAKWARCHPEALKANVQRMREYYSTDAGKASLVKQRKKIRDTALDRLGGRCSNPACQWLNPDGSRGCTDRRCLQIDHVRGGGSKELKKLGTNGIYRKIAKGNTEGYQALCANCNWIKRVCNKEEQ